MPQMRRCWEVPAAGHRTGLSRHWEGTLFRMKLQVDRISPDYSGSIGTWAHAKIALRHCPVFLSRRILQRVLPERNSS